MLSLMIPNTTSAAPLHPAAFLAVWLCSAIFVSVISGRWKYAARAAAGESEEVYDEDDVLDPREKARRDKEKELNSDLSNAADLLGQSSLGGEFLVCITIVYRSDWNIC